MWTKLDQTSFHGLDEAWIRAPIAYLLIFMQIVLNLFNLQFYPFNPSLSLSF